MTENEKIVKIIVEKNTKLYGEIQECCLMHKNYCVCNKNKLNKINNLVDKESTFLCNRTDKKIR